MSGASGAMNESASRSSGAPRLAVIVLPGVLLLACAVFGQLTMGLAKFVATHGDMPVYLRTAEAIRAGDLASIRATNFWGLPYAAAAVSFITRLPVVGAMVLICLVSSIVSVWLVAKLWGGWMAIAFAVIDWTWIEFSAFGGAEPLFMALLLGAVWYVRAQRSSLALLLAALATIVRPLGVLMVVALLLELWRARGFAYAAVRAAIPAAIMVLYMTPLVIVFHDPLANFHFYQREAKWSAGLPITFPLLGLARNYLSNQNLGNVVLKHLKVGCVLLHVGALVGILSRADLRSRALAQPMLAIFSVGYSGFMIMYSSPIWALSIYPRLIIPVIPFFLWVYEPWLPKTWRRWAPVAAFSLLLACGSGLGFSRATELLHHH
jgi:hypothetical protein